MKSLKFEYENFPNESLGQVKHFKHVFGVGVGWEFEKMWIKIKNIRASADIYWYLYKKEGILFQNLLKKRLVSVDSHYWTFHGYSR